MMMMMMNSAKPKLMVHTTATTTTENSNKLLYSGLVRDLQYNHVPQRVLLFGTLSDKISWHHYKRPTFVNKSMYLFR